MVGKINIQKSNFPAQGEALIYFTYQDQLQKDKNLSFLNQKTKNKIEKAIKKHDFQAKEEEKILIHLDDFYSYLLIIGGGKKQNFDLVKWMRYVADGLRLLKKEKIETVNIFYQEELGNNFFEIGKKLTLSFYLSSYSFDQYKSKKNQKKIKKLESLEFFIDPILSRPSRRVRSEEALRQLEEGVNWGKIVASGVYLARDLVNQPASYLHPQNLVKEAFKIEKESKGKIKVEVLDKDECQRLGMGAFLAVAQGSDQPPKFIILSYENQSSKENKSICLIGKTITFDSGGLSLKPAEAMEWMKVDMAGGASVLGVFKILSQINNKFEIKFKKIYGILPAAENMPSGKAIRPGDVVRALNGASIEILNTDAEGRLTLADALSYAEKYLKPDICIDLATLTGACMVALGEEVGGLFANDKELADKFLQTAEEEGEFIWPLPLFDPYKKLLESSIADLKNIGGRYGGAITAALFLKEFVEKMRWIHLDIAGPAFNHKEEKNILSKGGTGIGVITLAKILSQSI